MNFRVYYGSHMTKGCSANCSERLVIWIPKPLRLARHRYKQIIQRNLKIEPLVSLLWVRIARKAHVNGGC